MLTGMNGLDNKIKSKDWVPVTVSSGWLAAMNTSIFACFEVVDDSTVNMVEKQGTNESNDGQVQRCEHDSMGE